jgi:hypothetical protein
MAHQGTDTDLNNPYLDEDEEKTPEEKKREATGIGAGALAGGAAGAAIGTAVPGVGNVVGAVVGGLVGGATGALAGKAIADSIDPEKEDRYWRDNYATRSYARGGSYDDYGPAYKYGWETRGAYGPDARFDQVERDLERDWPNRRGSSKLSWDRARHASRDAWDRIERALPGDADRDGK